MSSFCSFVVSQVSCRYPHQRQAQHGSHDPSAMETEGGTEINRDQQRSTSQSLKVQNLPVKPNLLQISHHRRWTLNNVISGCKLQCNSRRSCIYLVLSRTIAIYGRTSWCIFLCFVFHDSEPSSCELQRGWQETTYVKQRKELRRRIEPLSEICKTVFPHLSVRN